MQLPSRTADKSLTEPNRVPNPGRLDIGTIRAVSSNEACPAHADFKLLDNPTPHNLRRPNFSKGDPGPGCPLNIAKSPLDRATRSQFEELQEED